MYLKTIVLIFTPKKGFKQTKKFQILGLNSSQSYYIKYNNKFEVTSIC